LDRVADVRVIAATARAGADLGGLGRLAQHLQAAELRVPPLRERRADLAGIAQGWLAHRARHTGRGPWQLTAAALTAIAAYGWPGNLRELINLLERQTLLVAAGPIDLGLVAAAPMTAPIASSHAPMPTTGAGAPAALVSWADNEREHLRAVLARTGGRIYGAGGAAEILGVKPSTLQSRMRKLRVARIPGTRPA
jgi:DNA-binding NtrC family response regulator